MADHDITPAQKPFAHEIAAYTDDQLNHYLEANGRIVSVQDPENIPPAFIQRLRDIVTRSREATKSSAVDLDQVAARLETVPTDRGRFSRSPSLATTESAPPQEEQDLECLREETEYYSQLVEAGGRPPYPFHLLEDIFWNQQKYLEYDEYRDVMFYCRAHYADEDQHVPICCHLLGQWESFRRVQCIIREHSFRTESKLIYEASHLSTWGKYLEHQRSTGWVGQWGFQEYAERMKARLSKYGFTRPFQLEKDLDCQDKLTTWIEYLGYEYFFYDRAASFVKRLQGLHDNAWKKLIDSNVLRPEETCDVICDVNTKWQHHNERSRAEKAVELATAAISSTEGAIAASAVHSSIMKLRQRLTTEQATLKAAKESLASLITRDDAIIDFLYTIREYRWQEDKADRHSSLLRWIEQQIPSIELELASLNSAEDDPYRFRRLHRGQSESVEGQQSQNHTQAEGDKQSHSIQTLPSIPPVLTRESHKRRHSSFDNDPPPKRLKGSRHEAVASSSTPDTSALATAGLTPGTRRTQGLEVVDISSGEPTRLIKPLRRSARIAEMAKTAMAAKTLNHLPPAPPERTGRRKAARLAKKR